MGDPAGWLCTYDVVWSLKQLLAFWFGDFAGKGTSGFLVFRRHATVQEENVCLLDLHFLFRVIMQLLKRSRLERDGDLHVAA